MRADRFCQVTLAHLRMQLVLACVVVWPCFRASAATTNDAFASGLAAYQTGQFAAAARAFDESAKTTPATGTLLNLGLSEWRRGRAGAAIRAWEEVLWMSPRNAAAEASLAYARRLLDVEVIRS